MNTLRIVITLALGAVIGTTAGYWYASQPTSLRPGAHIAGPAAAAERSVLYYRDPSGAPLWSVGPKKDPQGRDYLPVYDDEEPSFEPVASKRPQTANGQRRVLYYRNPMGLPDTSPVPKKDSMGMDYIPVYEGEDENDGSTVKVSLDKVQRSGVRTERVESRVLVRPVRGIGTVKYDERRLTVVTLRADGYIEDLFVNATGQAVKAGDPLFRVYSKDIQIAQSDLIVAAGVKSGTLGIDRTSIQGTIQRLRNLAVPESRIELVRTTGTNPRTIDWPSPATGTAIEKRVVNGQQVTAGEELYRIADLSQVWVIAEVAEADLSSITVGIPATVTLRAYPNAPAEGRVTFIYPDIKPETRTARVRIELPNPDGRLKIDMYADVVFHEGTGERSVATVPDSAVIDSGTQQVVLVVRGGGRFEPRVVKLGRRGDGYREVIGGLREGEEIVTSATFLIDAESNLRAALKTFAQDAPTRREASP